MEWITPRGARSAYDSSFVLTRRSRSGLGNIKKNLLCAPGHAVFARHGIGTVLGHPAFEAAPLLMWRVSPWLSCQSPP
jgi:hypothetical protein